MYGTGYYATGYYATAYYVGNAPSGPILFTYQLLLEESRALLKDTDREAGLRYPDDMMVSALNRGLNELNRIRPDAWYPFYGQYTDHVPEVVITNPIAGEQVDWTTEFQPDFRFYPAVVHYVVGQIAIQEDEQVEGLYPRSNQLFRSFVLNT